LLECRSDSVALRFEGVETPMVLTADGIRLPVLDTSFDTESGAGSVVAYPILKTQSRVTISIRGADPVEVALP
jgi:hypothetical protein